MVETNTFGEVLRALRDRRGWTGERLAEEAGLTQGLISKYERGIRAPKRPTIIRIAAALGVSPDELLVAAGYQPARVRENTLPLPPNAQVVRPRPGVTIVLDPAYFIETTGPEHDADRMLVIRATEEMEARGHATARRDDMRETGKTAAAAARDPKTPDGPLEVVEGGGG